MQFSTFSLMAVGHVSNKQLSGTRHGHGYMQYFCLFTFHFCLVVLHPQPLALLWQSGLLTHYLLLNELPYIEGIVAVCRHGSC